MTPTTKFAEAWLRILENLHASIEKAIDGLPQEALDWVPGPEMNSIAVLVAHLAGSTRYLIGDVVAQDPSQRDRAAEFRTQGLDAAALRQRLLAARTYARGVLEKLAPQDLETLRLFPRDGSQVSVAWAVAHTLEHTALHTGHIEITRQLWDMRQKK